MDFRDLRELLGCGGLEQAAAVMAVQLDERRQRQADGGGANMLRASSRRYGWLVSIPDAVDGTPEWQFWSQFAGSMLWLLSAP